MAPRDRGFELFIQRVLPCVVGQLGRQCQAHVSHTLEVHTLLVTDLWNEFIVRLSEVAQLLGTALDKLLGSAAATDKVFGAFLVLR